MIDNEQDTRQQAPPGYQHPAAAFPAQQAFKGMPSGFQPAQQVLGP